MGRKTLESFPGGPRPPQRGGLAPGGLRSGGGRGLLHAGGALEATNADEKVWLIGGASIYQALLDKCERAYVTVNECVREADAWFPNLDESPDWEVEAREKGGVTEAGVPFEFVTYRHG